MFDSAALLLAAVLASAALQDSRPTISSDAELRAEVTRRLEAARSLTNQAPQAADHQSQARAAITRAAEALAAYEAAREDQRLGRVSSNEVEAAERRLIGTLISLEELPFTLSTGGPGAN